MPLAKLWSFIVGGQRQIPDDLWFELQFDAPKVYSKYGIRLPSLPPDEVQLAFTARAGRVNLQQAFSFYQYVRETCRLLELEQPMILDFGGGWGRIARFFLRDTTPERLYIADCMSSAIEWLHNTSNPCRIIQNNPHPPIEGLPAELDLIYAFSVFSHLSEQCLHEWMDYFMTGLRPNGHVVFTTRGHQFCEQLEQLHREKASLPPGAKDPHARLREQLPSPEILRERLEKGEFQFYPIGGARELTTDFYGETFIPRNYLEAHYGKWLVDFTEAVPEVDQSVVVLRKR